MTAMDDASFDREAFLRLLSVVCPSSSWLIERLRGGANNRVFLAQSESGRFVIKQYHRDVRDQRDRLDPEFAFLRYAWNIGIRVVPQPIACDTEQRLGLYGFIDGTPFAPGQTIGIGNSEIDAALDFVRQLNRHREQGHALPPGAESCFCLDDHLTLIARRIERLRTLDRSTPHGDEAHDLVTAEVIPAFARVEAGILSRAAALGVARGAVLPFEARCISPSDFGFHNAIRRDDGAIAFCDFEYAGWDDPAKLVCDFFCQPAVPVAPMLFPVFAAGVAELMGEEQGVERYAMLLDLYRLKWICIIMNDFLPAGRARRHFATADDHEQRCAAQLAKARLALAAIPS
jgi:hypothetical protein